MISLSIVLYKNNDFLIKRILKSIENTIVQFKLYLIDNSPTDELKILSNNLNIDYYHFPSNPGFGAGHNIAIEKAMNQGSKYHFIVNPDIYFEEDVITQMVELMKSDENIGMIMPQILYPNNKIQYLPKLLPTPLCILKRKLKFPKYIFNRFIKKYELRDVPKDMIYNAPIISGCFTLLNLEAIKTVGKYDDSFFMYFEDWDLSRRMHKYYKTIYFPRVSVYHEYESGANKNKRLFFIFIKSGIHYFNKWGWFFDKERIIINKKALNQFNK